MFLVWMSVIQRICDVVKKEGGNAENGLQLTTLLVLSVDLFAVWCDRWSFVDGVCTEWFNGCPVMKSSVFAVHYLHTDFDV